MFYRNYDCLQFNIHFDKIKLEFFYLHLQLQTWKEIFYILYNLFHEVELKAYVFAITCHRWHISRFCNARTALLFLYKHFLFCWPTGSFHNLIFFIDYFIFSIAEVFFIRHFILIMFP